MRLITWNCHHGDCDARASELNDLQPDLIVLQECKRPTREHDSRCQWLETQKGKHIVVLARNGYVLERGPVMDAPIHSMLPVRVTGEITINLLAVHSQNDPSYVLALDRGLSTYADFLKQATPLIAGDFNSHSRFDKKRDEVNHSTLVRRLRNDFGLVSAYHTRREDEEQPTHFHQYKEEQPFHIDYCFIPEVFVPGIREAKIVAFDDWKTRSDHHPIVVDLDTSCTST